MQRVKYNGSAKQKICFTTMGQGFSYNVIPGEILTVPNIAIIPLMGCGVFEILNSHEEPSEVQIVNVSLDDNNEEYIDEESDASEETLNLNEQLDPRVDDEFEDFIPRDEEEQTFGPDDTEPPYVAEETEKEVVEEMETEEIKIDYTSKRKAELKDMCAERGLKVTGNRDDLITRLVDSDNDGCHKCKD